MTRPLRPRLGPLWSMRGNLFEDGNIKTDTFTTGNGARIGNWPAVWGVGSSGECMGREFLGRGRWVIRSGVHRH